jgi:hypothetical protein
VSDDLSRILREWPWDPENNVRLVTCEDGRKRVQIRVCVHGYHGILQFDCDGRPDGMRPYGRPFALDHFESLASADPAFRLDPAQAQELFDEGTMVYQRYVVLYQLGDYGRVVADTERNMRLFRFVHRVAAREEDRNHLERWWPYILRMHGAAQAMSKLAASDSEGALACLDRAIAAVESLEHMDDETFQYERGRSITVLTDLRRQIESRRPMGELEVLEGMLQRAVRTEKYELAARLRDQIDELKQGGGRGPSAGA